MKSYMTKTSFVGRHAFAVSDGRTTGFLESLQASSLTTFANLVPTGCSENNRNTPVKVDSRGQICISAFSEFACVPLVFA